MQYFISNTNRYTFDRLSTFCLLGKLVKTNEPILTGYLQLSHYLVNKIVIMIGYNFTSVFYE